MEPKRELLFKLTRKDFVIEAKRGHGKGGQNRNVTNSACRITHPPSGATAQAQDQRDYKQNEQAAFLRLTATPEFKTWHKLEVARRMGMLKSVEREVDRQMSPENLKVEVKSEDGKWVDEGDGHGQEH